MKWIKSHKEQLIPVLLMPIFLMLLLFVLCVIFFGSAYNNISRFSNLRVICVDLDGGVVGSSLLANCQAFIDLQQNTLPGYSLETFPNGTTLEDVQNVVYNGDAWAALVANANATANLVLAKQDLLVSGVTSYNPANALSLVFDEGRNSGTHAVLETINREFLRNYQTRFASLFWKDQFSNQNFSSAELVNLTSLIVLPITYTTVNLHPTNAVSISAQTIGLILLVVFSFLFLMASSAFMLPLIWSFKSLFHKFLWMNFVHYWGTFWMSLGFTASVAIFSGVEAGNFMEYWMLNWLQQLVYLSALVVIFPIFKEKLGPIFACFLVLNITGAFQNLVVEQQFYYWGYATPFYHAITATRHILFGSFNQLYINLPCLFAMLVFSTILFPFVILLNEHVLVKHGMGFPPPSTDGEKELDAK